ncbi:MAG: hypothetical protein ABIZ09_00415 [Rhodoferax sp.]
MQITELDGRIELEPQGPAFPLFVKPVVLIVPVPVATTLPPVSVSVMVYTACAGDAASANPAATPATDKNFLII